MINCNVDQNTLVSVIIPVYNLEPFIEETIASLQRQTHQALEIIVVNDRSADRSWEIVKEIGKADSRLRLLENQRKKGASGARNTGLMAATGDWIAFLDGDDLLDANSINARLEAARLHPDADFISGDYRRFQVDIKEALAPQSEIEPGWHSVLGIDKQSNGMVRINKPATQFIKQHLTCMHACLLSKDLVRHVGLFDETLPRSEDVHFWLRTAARASAYIFTSASTSYYRSRIGSLSSTQEAPDAYAIRAFRSLRSDPYLQNHLKQLEQTIKLHIHKNTYHYRKRGVRLKAIRWALEGLFMDPFNLFSWKNLVGAFIGR